jgi:AAA15 family ATPase/GTPase
MAINRVEIKDFLVFKGEFAVDFCPGVNVIIGGNATGKTTLLKALYLPYVLRQHETKEIRWFLTSGDLMHIKNYGFTSDTNLKIICDNFEYIVTNGQMATSGELIFQKPPVFIPVTEMLSHSKGFLELNTKYEIDFDQTEIDILVNAGLPITREVSLFRKTLLDKISKVINGEVLYEDGKYYIVKTSGSKIEFSLEASGFKKFGLLWKLIHNGLLERGMCLFWDEPEASINPEHMSVLVDVLLELQRGGVQIFLATHSEILASYFAVNREREKGDKVKFYSLYKDQKTQCIKVDQDDRFDLLTPNSLTAEPVKIYEKELLKGLDNA